MFQGRVARGGTGGSGLPMAAQRRGAEAALEGAGGGESMGGSAEEVTPVLKKHHEEWMEMLR